ncbi:hypothetical protein PG994_011564 [Apiospora phragmitis]|uniref:AA1-like domain-containing protein n=1 Tax=Apiospora phragmitis TaxID=2905665 RepID=A0ABR1TVT6_9PEZI
MLLPVVLALAASCTALSILQEGTKARQAFLIPYVYSFSPSGRPGAGNSPYCQLTFNVTDAATNDDTQCKVQYGPCAWSGERPPEMPKPDAPKPAKCQNEDFKFWFSKFDSMRNFSLEITHTYHDKDTRSDVVHTGDSGWINHDLSSDRGYSYTCGGSGVCSMGFRNNTDPLVATFK